MEIMPIDRKHHNKVDGTLLGRIVEARGGTFLADILPRLLGTHPIPAASETEAEKILERGRLPTPLAIGKSRDHYDRKTGVKLGRINRTRINNCEAYPCSPAICRKLDCRSEEAAEAHLEGRMLSQELSKRENDI